MRILVYLPSLFIMALCARTESVTKLEVLSQEMVDYIDSHPKSTWQAARSSHFKTLADALMRLGAKREPANLKRTRRRTKILSGRVELPEFFDARIQWPNCPTIGQIRDQSGCGSCWAFGAVEAMSDRICIHSNASINVELSARNLLSCCLMCGFGCQGGIPALAWDYWYENGIVTGGSFEHPTGCQPYSFPSCDHQSTGQRPPCKKHLRAPMCNDQCRPGYNVTYADDRYFSEAPYNIKNDENAIMEEVIQNGPIEVTFSVYEDFLTYKSGVYQYITGKYLGEHAVKLLGWGVEKGIKYWLLANSWNEDWGEKGFFRVRRGVNECEIESEPVAGMPQFS